MPVWIDLRFLLLLVWLFSAIHQYLYIGPARVCQAPVQREMRAPSSNAASGGGCLRSGIRSLLVALPPVAWGLNEALGPRSLAAQSLALANSRPAWAMGVPFGASLPN